MNLKKILIFGTFDGIHEGHLSFIKDAKKEGDQLVAIVARDEIVEKLKGKLPKHSEIERINFLLNIPEVDLVLLGDSEISTYKTVKEVNPNIIFLGYDQVALSEDLNRVLKTGDLKDIEIKYGNPYKPEFFHTSIINKK